MKANEITNPPNGHGFKDLQTYADAHGCVPIGEYHYCRVITNTRHGRKDTVCGVVRAYKMGKTGKRILGYIVGFKEIEFKPDRSNYVYVKL